MNAEEFRQAGREMVDFIADYLENIGERRVLPEVVPGFMKDLIPSEAPEEPEEWDKIMPDIERVIMPGVTHWNHPNFHAYCPSNTSFPSILGEMLSSGIAGVGFSWLANPAMTELKVIVLDWLAKLMQLPQDFLSGGKGGGIIQGSACESTLMAMLAARSKAMKKLKAYTAMDKDALIAFTKYKSVQSDGNDRLRGEALREAMAKDRAAGLVPYFVQATLGTTAQCAFDALDEIGPVCQEFGAWLHIDAAYAGTAFICPEHRHLLNGIEYADSFNFNGHKWMRINFDCSPMWFRESCWLVETFHVDPEYLKHPHQNGIMPDFRHWQIPLSRRFRALKVWFVLRSFGAEGLRKHIRKQCGLAHMFAKMLQKDSRFELTHAVSMALVCFRLKGYGNAVTEKLMQRMMSNRRIHPTGALSKGVYFIRIGINGSEPTEKDVQFSYRVLDEITTEMLSELK